MPIPNPPKISVIMPVYNAERYLRLSIESILTQTYEEFEFIIVNDGSTDDSQKIIDHFAAMDPRIVSVKQSNKGVVASANYAISIAKGEYISRADADDISLEHKIEDLVECAKKHPDAAVICGSIEVIDEDSKFIQYVFVPVKNDDLKRAFYLRNPIPNGATLIKKEAFQSVGGYENVFAEDCHLWTKLFDTGDFIGTGSIIYKWRANSSGLTLSNNLLSMQKEKEYVDTIWRKRQPPILNRKSVIDGRRFYLNFDNIHRHEYADVFISDLTRLSIHLIKRGYLKRGLYELIAIGSIGVSGITAVFSRLMLTLYGNCNRITRK